MELLRKLVLAFFLVIPPSWGLSQVYATSGLQTIAAMLLILRRPHSSYMSNIKASLVQGSQAATSLAMLVGSLQLWDLQLPDLAIFVMYTQIFTRFDQLKANIVAQARKAEEEKAAAIADEEAKKEAKKKINEKYSSQASSDSKFEQEMGNWICKVREGRATMDDIPEARMARLHP